jgi:hypothetical protein
LRAELEEEERAIADFDEQGRLRETRLLTERLEMERSRK